MKSRVPRSRAGKITPAVRTSLSDDIVRQITDLISRGALRPGDRLPSERELCKQFGVGRTSLREALRSLIVMGILDVRLGEGTFVSDSRDKYLEKTLEWGLLLDPKVVEDLIETRVMLESQNAFLAAQRATAEDLEKIEQAIRGMEESLHSTKNYLEFDLKFHLAIARATRNKILYQLLSMTRGYLQEWIKKALSRRQAELSLREHEEILKALRSSNPEQARSAMTAHIVSSSADLRANIDEGKKK